MGSTSQAALRAGRSVRYRTDTTASQDSLSICIFSVAAVADRLPTGLGASVAHDRSQRKESKFCRISNDRHTCRCGLLEFLSVCWRRRVSVRSSARSRHPTQIFQTRTHRSNVERRRADPRMGPRSTRNRSSIRSTAETGCVAPRAASSNRCGRSSVPATSEGNTLPTSGSREVLPAAHPAVQSPRMP
jgi:hypothetical protein